MRQLSSFLVVSSTLLLERAASQILPYNPTSVFLSPNDSDITYIFSPSTPTSSQAQLLSLNISSSIQASSLTTKVLTSSLPFLSNDASGNATAYVPAISRSGSIGVYAGSCSSASSFWTYQPANSSAASSNSDSGTWSQISTTVSASITSNDLSGANFLASSFYFSTLYDASDAQRTIYTFGGMCPTSSSTNVSTWQGAATYSNRMMRLSQSPSSADYQVSLSASTGNKPIAEAGFTMTGLVPAISNSSSGVVTQARNYVLIGGHTQHAFINMSQVALFSLPQENWSFQTIDAAPSAGSPELAVKSASTTPTTPDSRSGHTALLSSDGSSIVVFGGWVGDVTQAADPQLAILRVGSGFGGNGDWAWEIPSTTGTGLQSGQGIYGHGAIMLPGNVMMVVGGSIIGSVTKSKRASTTPQALFLNTTSLAWISEYTNPAYVASTGTGSSSGGSSSSSNSSSNATKVGLGAGLGIGLAAILGAIIVYFWYSRRLKRGRRAAREKDLQNLSHDALRDREMWWGGLTGRDMMQQEGLITNSQNLGNRGMAAGNGNSGYTYSQGNGYNDYDEQSMQGGSGGNSGSIPRKPLNTRARGYYQPTPNTNSNASYSAYDLNTSNTRSNSLGTAGAIHPIYEADEETESLHGRSPSQGQDLHDPFRDPAPSLLSPLRSNPTVVLPDSAAQSREREIKEWVSDWAAADAMLSARNGRISPSKESVEDRTISSLSERSAATLQLSRQNSVRSNSLTAFFSGSGGWNPFTANAAGYGFGPGDVSPISDRSVVGKPPLSAGSGSGASESFATAHSHTSHSDRGQAHGQGQNFSSLRADGETLLPEAQGSPSKARRAKQFGWLGSLKKVLGGEEWVHSDGSSGSGRSSPMRERERARSPSLSIGTGAAMGGTGQEPRRTVSASAALWRRKQGRGDWEDSADGAAENLQRRSNTLTLDGDRRELLGSMSGGTENGDDDDEWDIERAIERRVVQVMFTVPREKLRVVNGDVEEGKEVSEGKKLLESDQVLAGEKVLDGGDVLDADMGKGKGIDVEGRSPNEIRSGSPVRVSRGGGGGSASSRSSARSGRSNGSGSPRGKVAVMVEKMEGMSPRV